MSPAPVAAVIARIGSIEMRFGRHGGVPGSAVVGIATTSSPSARSAPSSQSFAGVLDATAGRALGIAALDEVATTPAAPRLVDDAVHDGSVVAASAPLPGSDPSLQGPVAADIPFADLFEAAGLRHGVPPRLLAAVGWVESRFQVDALSPDGAIGLMQIMPMTAQELGVDPTDPRQAVDGAARLLASQRDRFGSWDLALAAYHSGGGAVARAGNQPPPRAAEYVRRVHDRLEDA